MGDFTFRVLTRGRRAGSSVAKTLLLVLDADPDAPAPWLATAFIPGLTLHLRAT
ncbi:hypothetical protein [Streptomyces wuyuanensis]|uniref:hypothetical protein n=1 Tax=Streptomyces wuyuanensis TaxID=1196353 RepID=UPI003D71751B